MITMKNTFKLLTALSFLCLPIGSAIASTTGAVGGASVKKGKSAVDFRVGYSEADESSSQDERLRLRTHYDYGLTDYYALRVILSSDKRKGDNMEAESIAIENRFYLLKADEYGFDFGARLKYSHKDGDKKPDSAAIGLYQQIPLEDWTIRFNETFSHEVGEDSTGGIALELRSQAMYSIQKNFNLGIESFNDISNLNEQAGYSAQSHTIGPVIKGKFDNNIGYEAGYRTGISDGAPDHSIKLFLSTSF
jgi:hypothetical protein